MSGQGHFIFQSGLKSFAHFEPDKFASVPREWEEYLATIFHAADEVLYDGYSLLGVTKN